MLIVEKDGVVKKLINENEISDYVIAGWRKVDAKKDVTNEDDAEDNKSKRGIVINK